MQPKGRILIVDDEVNARPPWPRSSATRTTRWTRGGRFKALPKLDDFRARRRRHRPAHAGHGRLELMPASHRTRSHTPVVVVHRLRRGGLGVKPMRHGAPTTSRSRHVASCGRLGAAWRRATCARKSQRLRQRLAEREGIDSVVGSSAAMKAVLEDVMRVPPQAAC